MLTDIWRDIISMGGFLLTFAGLLYTMRQVRLANTAATAAREAAEKSLAESRRVFEMYVASLAHRFINEARNFIAAQQWSAVSMRLNDLADQLAQLVTALPSVGPNIPEVRYWAGVFGRLATGELTRFQSRRWVDFEVALQTMIDELHGPFTRRGPLP